MSTKKIRVCINIWECSVVTLYIHSWMCILKRKLQITSQRLFINVTCGSLHCPDDHDCWWLYTSNPALKYFEDHTYLLAFHTALNTWFSINVMRKVCHVYPPHPNITVFFSPPLDGHWNGTWNFWFCAPEV